MTIAMYDYIWTLRADTYRHIVSCKRSLWRHCMERLETMYMGLHVLISFEFWVKWYVYFQRYHIWYSGQYTYLNGDNAIGIGMHGSLC